jgi:hypothetical protein
MRHPIQLTEKCELGAAAWVGVDTLSSTRSSPFGIDSLSLRTRSRLMSFWALRITPAVTPAETMATPASCRRRDIGNSQYGVPIVDVSQIDQPGISSANIGLE